MKAFRFAKNFSVLPAALALGLALTFPAAAEVVGHLDDEIPNTVSGWVWDDEDPDRTFEVHIDVTPEGASKPVLSRTVTADSYRASLKESTGFVMHGFAVPVPWTDFDGDVFVVTGYAIVDGRQLPYTETLTYTKSSSSTSVSVSEGPDRIGRFTDSSYAADGAAREPETTAASDSAPASSSGTIDKSYGPGYAGASSQGSSAWKQGQSLGVFTTTGYCSCSLCSGGWGRTYSGTVPQANHTIAADISVLPIGTKVMINGIVYTVEDIGSGVASRHIDIYFDTHEEASAYGTQQAEVFAVTEN